MDGAGDVALVPLVAARGRRRADGRSSPDSSRRRPARRASTSVDQSALTWVRSSHGSPAIGFQKYSARPRVADDQRRTAIVAVPVTLAQRASSCTSITAAVARRRRADGRLQALATRATIRAAAKRSAAGGARRSCATSAMRTDPRGASRSEPPRSASTPASSCARRRSRDLRAATARLEAAGRALRSPRGRRGRSDRLAERSQARAAGAAAHSSGCAYGLASLLATGDNAGRDAGLALRAASDAARTPRPTRALRGGLSSTRGTRRGLPRRSSRPSSRHAAARASCSPPAGSSPTCAPAAATGGARREAPAGIGVPAAQAGRVSARARVRRRCPLAPATRTRASPRRSAASTRPIRLRAFSRLGPLDARVPARADRSLPPRPAASVVGAGDRGPQAAPEARAEGPRTPLGNAGDAVSWRLLRQVLGTTTDRN